MSKTYDTSKLKVVLYDGNEDTIPLDKVYEYSRSKRLCLWDVAPCYIIYWKRGECDSQFLQRIFNPDKLPEHVVAKWIVDLCKNEGAYKAELFDTMCKRRVKELKKSKKSR